MNNGLLQPSARETVARRRFAVIVDSQSRQRHRPQRKSEFHHSLKVQPVVDFYLVRHGDALSAAEDPKRPLSAAGRAGVERTAQLALQRNLQVSTIYHSGILRAQQTAEILAAHLMSSPTVAQLAGLLPEDDPAIVRAELEVAPASVLLVGHLPFMSRLAGLLIHGDPERPVVEFPPGAMACLTRSAAHWELRWRIAP